MPAEGSISVLFPCLGALFGAPWAHLWATGCSCHHHGGLEDVAQADQVVGDHVQPKYSADVVQPPQLELAQATELLLLRRRLRLDPAKYLLDAAAGIDRLEVQPLRPPAP